MKQPRSLDAKQFLRAAECLKALAHPQRLLLLHLLLTGRHSVGELAEKCSLASHVCSEHLRLMQRCGFLSSEREGRLVFYKVVEERISKIMDCIVSY